MLSKLCHKIRWVGHDFGTTWPPAATLTSQRNKFKNRVPSPFLLPLFPLRCIEGINLSFWTAMLISTRPITTDAPTYLSTDYESRKSAQNRRRVPLERQWNYIYVGIWHCDGRERLSKACSSSRSAPIAASLRSILYPSNMLTIDNFSWQCCRLAVCDSSRERRILTRQTDRHTFLCIPRQCSFLFPAEWSVGWWCARTPYQLTVLVFWHTTSRHWVVDFWCFQTIWRHFL